MTLLGLAVRFAHLAVSVLLVGTAALVLLAGPSDRPTARRWEARMLRWARALTVGAVVTGLAALAWQVVYLEGRAGALLEPAPLARAVFETRTGTVWLVRTSLLAVLGVFLAAPLDVSRRLDWRAARGEALLLGAAALGLGGAASHAAAVEPGVARAVVADVLHLLAAGVWAGGLVPLGLLLRMGAAAEGADARPHAVRAARRFSRLALLAVVTLGVTGLSNAVLQVGSVAGLLGTPYGRLLLGKLGLLVPILGLAVANRRRHLPALAGEAATVGRPAMRRLARFVALEAALALGILGLVAAMGLTPPARHDQPVWPLGFRLTTDVLAGDPARGGQVFVGSQVLVLAGLGALVALAQRRWRAPLLAGTGVAMAAGAWLALAPLAIDAYPTTYLRSAVPYEAASIVIGHTIFQERCARCHGRTGAGDGPDGRGLPRPPADLRSAHTAHHTAGDLFWWVTHGIPAAGMPAFGEALSPEERWDVINFVRTVPAAWQARTLGAAIEPGRPSLVAPDFAFAVGPTPARRLRDYRGARIVLLVVYTLPGSQPRLAALAERYPLLATLGVEVIAVPADAAPDALRRLGAHPRILFPVVTEGAREIVDAYRLFAPPPHAEFLIDRQGYLRAIARGAPGQDVNPLLAEVQALNAEPVTAAAPAEHVH